jgi:hypothetical protein
MLSQTYGGLIHSAARYGVPELIRVADGYFCDFNALTSTGDSPLHFAANSCPSEDAEETISCLIGLSADVNILNNAQKNPLDVARERNHDVLREDVLALLEPPRDEVCSSADISQPSMPEMPQLHLGSKEEDSAEPSGQNLFEISIVS